MKKCINCGKDLPLEARFCYVCGAAASDDVSKSVDNQQTEILETVNSSDIKPNRINDGSASSFVVNEPIISKETTDEERQAILDKLRSKLRWERALWLIAAIFSLVAYVSLWFGFITSVVYYSMNDYDTYYEEEYYDEYYDETYDEYYEDSFSDYNEDSDIIILLLWFGVCFGMYIFIPVSVFGFIMAAKSRKCLKTLYKDCSYTQRRCSSASIIIISAIFNPLVLIFTVPMFSITRNNSCLLKEIAEIQYNYYNYNPDVIINY